MSKQNVLNDLADKMENDAQTFERIALSTCPIDMKALAKHDALKLARQYVVEAIQQEQQQREHEQPQALSFLQLSEMEGKPVYDKNAECWRVIESVYNPDDDYAIDLESNPHAVISFTDGTEMDFDSDYFYLYANKPEGDVQSENQ